MHSPASIRLRSSARTSTGQVRENNEDNIHLLARDQFVLAVVADGMGGAVAGEEASRIAIDTIHEDLATPEYNDYQKYNTMEESSIVEMLRDAIRSANLNIVQRAVSYPALKGMGTTVTLAMVRETDVLVAHVGDSRAYLVESSTGEITQITSDHSFVEALVTAGHITREEARDHPMKNVLYRALGQSEDIDIDIYHSRMHVGDRLVLCSDGLTRHVKPEEIAETVLSDADTDITSQKLIDLANGRGGEDNISVVVILAEENQAARPSQPDIAISENDDDTLILKDRSRLREKETRDTGKLPEISEADTIIHPPKDPSNKGIESEGRDPLIPDQ
jgi:serine/threonine protein phosphatase PrpC